MSFFNNIRQAGKWIGSAYNQGRRWIGANKDNIKKVAGAVADYLPNISGAVGGATSLINPAIGGAIAGAGAAIGKGAGYIRDNIDKVDAGLNRVDGYVRRGGKLVKGIKGMKSIDDVKNNIEKSKQFVRDINRDVSGLRFR